MADNEDDGDRGPHPPSALQEYIDSEAGSGAFSSTEDWVRGHSRPHENDGRSPTNTYFDIRDVSGQYPPWQKHRKERNKRSWATIAGWQDGVQSDISRGGQNWQADKTRWVETFATLMGATEYHEERTKHVLSRLDMGPYQSRRLPTELVIVGILSLFIDADIDDFEQRALVRADTRDLLDDLECDVNDYELVRSQLRQEDGDLLFPDE